MPSATWKTKATEAAKLIRQIVNKNQFIHNLSTAEYSARVHSSLDDLSSQWEALHDSSNPFIDSRFLLALEQHGAVANELGWQAFHLSLQQGDELLAAAPGYLTAHSFGDFVYDWGWAQQAQQAGFNWYPKWVIEIPYSPVTGPRLLTCGSSLTHSAGVAMLVQAIHQLAAARGIDCVQVNYCDAADAAMLAEQGFLVQQDQQFHWQRQGENDFVEFLQNLRSKRRKEIRRERQKIVHQGIAHRWINGAEASDEDLLFAHLCYQKTFHSKGNFPALTLECLHNLARALGDRFLLCQAMHDATLAACAIFLRSQQRLYGRYWGCLQEFDSLHFETCYYQGIEYCLAHGLDVFEPGAGGGHKLQRGFLPANVYCCHWFREPDLQAMMRRQMRAEARLRESFAADEMELTPYKRS